MQDFLNIVSPLALNRGVHHLSRSARPAHESCASRGMLSRSIRLHMNVYVHFIVMFKWLDYPYLRFVSYGTL
jgi:hypothetical protein